MKLPIDTVGYYVYYTNNIPSGWVIVKTLQVNINNLFTKYKGM